MTINRPDGLGSAPALLRRAESLIDDIERLRQALIVLAEQRGLIEPSDIPASYPAPETMADNVLRAEGLLADCHELVERIVGDF